MAHEGDFDDDVSLKRQILDSSRLKYFTDDNFKFDETGRKFSKPVETTVGKGEIARYKFEQYQWLMKVFWMMTTIMTIMTFNSFPNDKF